MERVKSIMPVQIPGSAWNVRCRLQDGTERLLTTGAPYTLAQAEIAADNARRDIARHGVDAVFTAIGE